MRTDFETTPVWRLTIQLGLPAMIAQLFNILYSIVDRIYLGHMQTSAELALASVGICSLFRKGLYIIATLTLPLFRPLEDIFYASAIADIAGALFTLLMFYTVLRPRLRQLYS